MALLGKQSFVHGITPLYYLHFDEITLMEFNHILSLTNIEVARPFMDSVIELYEFVHKVYKEENLDGIPENIQDDLIYNRVIATQLVNWYTGTLSYGAKTLREIRDDNLVKYDVDHDVKLGQLSFNDLFAMNEQVIDSKLDQELRRYAVTKVDGVLTDLPEVMANLKELQDNLATSIGLIQKRIDRLGQQGSQKKGLTLTSCFKHVAEDVAKIDSMMMGETGQGVHDPRLYQFAQLLREKLSELGMDTSVQKYSKFMDNKSHILGLDKKNYNQNLIPRYETKKQVFEKYLRDATTKIELLKSDYQVPLYYF